MSDKPQQRSWYSTGYGGMDAEADRLARMHGPNRFWMKPESAREIVMVTDEPFAVYEHNPKLNGSFRNWITCVKDFTSEPACCEKLGENTRYYCGYYTIVDCTDTPEKKYQYEVKLLPAKIGTLKVLKTKKQDRDGSLVGAMFKVNRYSGDQPNVGGEFEFQKRADLDKLFKLATYKGQKLSDLYEKAKSAPDQMKRLKELFDISGDLKPQIYPFNYVSVLAPKENKDIRLMLGSYTAPTSDGEVAAGGDTSEGGVPF